MHGKRIKKTQDDGILFSLKKSGNLVLCDSVDKPWGHCASERSQPHEDKCCVIPLTGGIENSQIQSQRNKGVVARSWVGNGEMLVNGHDVPREEDKFERSALCRIRGPVHHLRLPDSRSIANSTQMLYFGC